MSEIAKIFKGLPKKFDKDAVKKPRVFYFSLDDDEKWTVTLGQDKCEVKEGKPKEDADCFFKSSKKMFLEVWNGKYTPSAKDFLTGAIKSNNPMLLKDFVAAFKKGSGGRPA
jgi:long-chain acyl-CoA synthetase